MFVLPAQAAIEMTRNCRANGIDVFGAEGFRLFGDRIQPQQEHSWDFEEDTPRRPERLVDFLAERLNSDLWFEVVTDEML